MAAGQGAVAQNAIAQTDYDVDEANYRVAKADVEVGKAQSRYPRPRWR